ncbi:MAG: thiamine-phosphate kinase [Xanthomonadales bacterium]|nr:thiamine-phosphate kinase [Xanthomonadales bacterium]
MRTEDRLIGLIARRFPADPETPLGIGDDAALLAVPAGARLAASCDALIEGTHFAPGADPADLGFKALAVNLSDLAAMGARPRWALLALQLPAAEEAWLAAFLEGFAALAARHRVTLAGGNLARGPLAVTVTVLGLVAAEAALRRDGARPGQRLWVTGALGAAAAALAARRAGEVPEPAWAERLDRPEPRVEAGLALAGRAQAAIDLSDGLLPDLERLCRASVVGARIVAPALPLAPGLAQRWPRQALALALAGGEDYELLFAADPDLDPRPLLPPGLAVTAIGEILATPGIRLEDGEGRTLPLPPPAFEHFPEAG